MLRLATATRTANVGRMAQQLPSAQSIVRPRSQLSWSGRSVATQSQAAQAAHQHREAEQSSDAAREREAASGVRARVQSKLRTLDASGPSAPSPFLRDRYARQHTYLRLSLTERCSLRCLYCMPADGVPLTPKPQLLTQPELARLANLFVQQGVNKIRLTGGEPTVRKDLVDVVASLNELKPLGLKQIGMTSNGIALHRKLPALVSSGLTHLNISLDTLDPFKFEFITRRRGLDAVMQSLSTAVALAVPSVKLNVVVIKGINDTKDVLDFVEFTKDWPITVRFIEYMPFDGNRWQEGKLVSYQTLLGTILEKYGDLQRLQDDANDTTKAWKVPGHKGQIGFITSMTDHFCGTCNRLRITADGNLKVCLFGNSEVSLRDAMRHGGIDGAGATDDQLLDVIGAAVGRKHARHAGMSDPTQLAKSLNRPMITIGG